MVKNLYKLNLNHFANLFSIISGQAISAIAAIIGLRLLSKHMTPSDYGLVTLSIGIIALLQGVIALPLLQSGLWCFPLAIADNRTFELKETVLKLLRNDLAFWLAGLVIVSCLFIIPVGVKKELVLAGIILLISEVIKSYEITFLNAEGRQWPMALLVISDALLKPTFAVLLLATTVLERSEAVLIGYSIGSWIALLFCWKTNKSSTFIAIFNVYQKGKQDGFTKALRDYAFPLRMNPLLGWLTGQGDRYIIGAFGGLHGVGIYSSLYSIVSRPFLMLSSIVELWFRQQFYTKVSVGDFRGAKKIFTLWISGVVASALALVFVLTALDSWVSNLILDARFQGYSHVMVWIGVGYVFHVAYLVVERVFYAFGNTKMVLKMQILGACLSALIPLLMVLKFGWVGAAWSVPFYFGIQLVVSIGVAKIKYGFLLRSADK